MTIKVGASHRCAGHRVIDGCRRVRRATGSDVPTLRTDLPCRVRGTQVWSARRRSLVTLDQSDHLDWLVLLRVRSGQMSKRDDRYVYRGQPFPAVSLVAVALHGLERAGMLALTESDEHGLATVALTEAGLAYYRALIERQRARPGPLSPGRPPVEFSASLLPAAGRSPPHAERHTRREGAVHGR